MRFESHGSDTASYQNQFHTLAACDAELERLRLADLDPLVMKYPTPPDPRAALGTMRMLVTQRRAALIGQGVTQ